MKLEASAEIVAVCLNRGHGFSKLPQLSIQLVEGIGIEGDAHRGATVRHRSRVAKNPEQPNLRQVHLIHSELFDELGRKGFRVRAGEIGENIATHGIDLLTLPVDTLLHLGEDAVVRVTGLRNPCKQLDRFQPGLMTAVLDRTPDGELVRKAGIMSVVVRGGTVYPGDRIRITLPEGPHHPLEVV